MTGRRVLLMRMMVEEKVESPPARRNSSPPAQGPRQTTGRGEGKARVVVITKNSSGTRLLTCHCARGLQCVDP